MDSQPTDTHPTDRIPTDTSPDPKAGHLSAEEVAALLGISLDAVHKRIKRGRLKAVKVEGRFSIPWPQGAPSPAPDSARQTAPRQTQSDISGLTQEIAVLKARIEALEEALRRTDAERDRLAAALEHARQQQAAHVEEVLRKDIIIQQLAQRIPALPMPEETNERKPWWKIWKW